MWILQGQDSDAGKVHYLLCGEVLVVGRRLGHILLSNDASISRKHASFSLHFPPANLKTREPAKVLLTDLQSKYGTFINDSIKSNQKLSPDIEQELHHGDTIRFGVFKNIWKLEHQNLTVTTSTLKAEGRQQLTNALLRLGGHLENEWTSNSSYLVMPSITLTVKVACALASGRNIVLPEFFTKLSEAIIEKAPHPNPADYLPQIMELKIRSGGASFAPDTRRSSIFNGLTFLFPTQSQMNRMSYAIQLAGGKAEMLSEENHREVVSGKSILINIAGESQNLNLYTKTSDLLQKHALRSIPEAEVGLAILYVSTEGYCNSSFKHSDIFKRSSSTTSQSSEKLKIFATETQAADFSISLTGGKVVPESGERRRPQTSREEEDTGATAGTKRSLRSKDGGKAEVTRPKRSNNNTRVPSPDCTVPLSTLDLCDDDDEFDGEKGSKTDIKMEVEEEESFKPGHTSTQVVNTIDTVDQSATVSFAPYTLPTLKTLEPEDDDDVEEVSSPKEDLLSVEEERRTGITKGGRNPKPKGRDDLKFDEWWKKDKEDDGVNKTGNKEEDGAHKKRLRNEELMSDQEAKKTKMDSDINLQTTGTNDNRCDSDGGTRKRKATESDDNIFALPARQRQRERSVESATAKPSGDTDLFALPGRSSRSRRTQQVVRPNIPATLPTQVHEPPDIPPSPTASQKHSQDSPSKPETKLNLTSIKENIPLGKFIERKAIPHVDDTVSTGETTLSRTLILVEPMIKVEIKPVVQSITSKSRHNSNLPNFKLFKKINSTCMMKIIGGSDLVESDKAVVSQEFNVDIISDSRQHGMRQQQLPSVDEELFNLGGRLKKKR